MSVPVRDPHEEVVVFADGVSYDQWESVQIEWEMNVPEITALLTTSEVGPFTEAPVFDKWHFPPGTAIEIFAGGTILFAGVVYSYMPSADAEQHSISLLCKTISRDWAISTAPPNQMYYQDTTDNQIVKYTANATGVEVIDWSIPDQVEWFNFKAGETYYAGVMRLFADSMKMLTAMRTGQLVILGGAPFKMGGALVQGINIKSMSAKLTDSQFSEHFALGQSPLGVDRESILQPLGYVHNMRGRSKHRTVLSQRAADKLHLQQRAMWDRNRNEGDAIQATIVTPGWRDMDGTFWMVNQNVYVMAPFLQIDCVLRTWKVVLTQNLSLGTVAEITLLDPIAVDPFMASERTACNSGNMWMPGFAHTVELVRGVAPLPTLNMAALEANRTTAQQQVLNAQDARKMWMVS